jgi:hypothetical protein
LFEYFKKRVELRVELVNYFILEEILIREALALLISKGLMLCALLMHNTLFLLLM